MMVSVVDFQSRWSSGCVGDAFSPFDCGRTSCGRLVEEIA
jgi:hypothetical protein